MHWLIQENVCQEKQWDEVIKQLEKFGIPYSVHKVVPFSGELIPEPVLEKNTPVWCYGSLSMLKTCKKNGWKPGCVDLESFTFADQRKALSGVQSANEMLNADATVTTFKEIHEDKVPLYGLTFVRPVDDSKFIAGSIMTDSQLRVWADKIVNFGDDSGADITADTQLIVASKKHIAKEFRFWVVKNKVVTWSQYKLGSTVIHDKFVPGSVIDYAERIVEFVKYWRTHINFATPDTFCLDVAELPSGKYKVIEFNNINSSGLYECDVQRLVDAIDYAYKDFKIIEYPKYIEPEVPTRLMEPKLFEI